MSQTNYTPQRYVELEDVSSGSSNYGEFRLAADFKTIIVDLDCDVTLDADLVVYKSNQYEAPDINQPASATNEYTELGYTSQVDGVYYTPIGGRYNPSAMSAIAPNSFNAESAGARWVLVGMINRVSGTIDKLSLSLFDNQ